MILTVLTNGTTEQTAFFDPDPAITPAEAEALYCDIETALKGGGVEALTLSGSSPAPATHGLHCDLIALANAWRLPVFLDTYGPASTVFGDFGQPSSNLTGGKRRSDCGKRASPTTMWLVCSRMGSTRGVVRGRHRWAQPGVDPASRSAEPCAIPPEIKAVNPIGSGDSLSAGLVDGWLDRLEPEPLSRARSPARSPTPWSGTLVPSNQGRSRMERAGCRRASATHRASVGDFGGPDLHA